ncbi:hypothetical protein RFI_18883, partial [Reticulomyxa filosa]
FFFKNMGQCLSGAQQPAEKTIESPTAETSPKVETLPKAEPETKAQEKEPAQNQTQPTEPATKTVEAEVKETESKETKPAETEAKETVPGETVSGEIVSGETVSKGADTKEADTKEAEAKESPQPAEEQIKVEQDTETEKNCYQMYILIFFFGGKKKIKKNRTTAAKKEETTATQAKSDVSNVTTPTDQYKQTNNNKKSLTKTSVGVSGGTEETEEKIADNLIIRHEIRSMSESEQNRWMDAILKMCENKSGPGTSEYFRLAGYHGLPGPYYCAHGKETFPGLERTGIGLDWKGWHRVYLREFEKALQAADRALGRDGNIFLPYWDWTLHPEQGLPAIIRKRFSEWPKDLFPTDFKIQKLKRADDKQIAKSILSYQVPQEASDCLLSVERFSKKKKKKKGGGRSLFFY